MRRRGNRGSSKYAGIAVFGGFIIGSDEDTPDTVADTALLAVQMGIDIIQITNLTPLPDTKLFERLRDGGRLLATDYPGDWERHSFIETVHRPKQMTARELDESIYELRHAAARQPWVVKRALRTLLLTRSISTALFVYGMNRGWKRMAKIQAPHDAKRFGFTPQPSARFRKIIDSYRMLRSSGNWQKYHAPVAIDEDGTHAREPLFLPRHADTAAPGPLAAASADGADRE